MTTLIEKLAAEYEKKTTGFDNPNPHFVAGAQALLQALSKEAGAGSELKEELYKACYTSWEHAQSGEYPAGSNHWMTMFVDKLSEFIEQASLRWAAKAEQNMQGWIDERADRKEIEKERDELKREVERLKFKLSEFTEGPIHTCHAECQRIECVLGRKLALAVDKIKKLGGEWIEKDQ